MALVQPGRPPAALHAERCGPLLEALGAANLQKVWRAVALTALEV